MPRAEAKRKVKRHRHGYRVDYWDAFSFVFKGSEEFPGKDKAITRAAELQAEGYAVQVVRDGMVVIASLSPR